MSYSVVNAIFSTSPKSEPHSSVPISPQTKAVTIVLLVLSVSFLMVWAAFCSPHKYLPLAGLGIFYGFILSYPAITLLGPRLQSAIGGLLGGISLGNISSKIAYGTTTIRAISQFCATTVKDLLIILGVEPKAEFLEDGIVICIWMALATMILVIFTNACLNVTRGCIDATSDSVTVPLRTVSGPAEKHMEQAAS
jgi:hypothetical protein